MRIVSLNIGRPAILLGAGRRISSAINRRPVRDRCTLTLEGFEGDRVSNTSVHGGPDKAVCCYPHEHYAIFAEMLGRDLSVPAFGENLTTERLLETAVCIGDVYRMGTALVQVAQPRQPCGTLAMKHSAPQLPGWIRRSGFSGFYLRVLESGAVQAEDTIELAERPYPTVSVAWVTQVNLTRPPNIDSLCRIAAVPPLSESWRKSIQRLLSGDDAVAE